MIDPGRKINTCEIERLLPKHFRVLRQRYRVQIDDAVKALVLVLKRDPIFERPQVIADMQIPRRLSAAKNTFLHKLMCQ